MEKFRVDATKGRAESVLTADDARVRCDAERAETAERNALEANLRARREDMALEESKRCGGLRMELKWIGAQPKNLGS